MTAPDPTVDDLTSRGAAVGAIVLAVIALFTCGNDAVPADWRAVTAGVVEAAQGELEARAGFLALRVEHIDFVDLAVLESELCGGRGIERDAAVERHVQTA